jgi:hypothetical protein
MASLSVEIVEGPDAGRQVELSGTLVIGREVDADLRLSDPQVSRHHVRITPGAGFATVEDLDSSNGTLIEGVEVMAPARWDPGEDLVVGTTVVELRTADAVAAQPSVVRPVPPALAAPERPPDYVAPAGAAPIAAGAPAVPQARPPGPVPELDELIDVEVRRAARIAPLAVFVLVALALVIYLAIR